MCKEPLSVTLAITKSGLTTSTPAGQTMSLALTTAGPVTLISNLLLEASSLSMRKTKSFKFKTMVVTSSSTPGRAVNS